ncbi:MAG: DUF3168 domain-containing protein [Pseudomonadota bacterium]
MSYGSGAALQEAVYQHLAGDTALLGLIGPAVFDALPQGPVPEVYVALGREDVRDRSSKTCSGAVHRFVISVVADRGGFARAKAAAAAVSDALVDAALTLDRGHLVSLQFLRAQARRTQAGQARRIDLTFQAFVSDL